MKPKKYAHYVFQGPAIKTVVNRPVVHAKKAIIEMMTINAYQRFPVFYQADPQTLRT